MKQLNEILKNCYEECPYNQETFDGGSGCMRAGKDISKYEENGFPFFCPLPDFKEEEVCEWRVDGENFEDMDYCHTGCGKHFGISINENVKFCPYCGKRIKETK